MGKIDRKRWYGIWGEGGGRRGELKEFIAMLVNFSTQPSRKEEVVFQV